MLPRMSAVKRLWWAIFLGLWLWPGVAEARKRGPVHYEVSIPRPETQFVEVTVTVDQARRRSTDLAMPAWTPGSYLVRDFARHVYGWRAESLDGAPLRVERTDKQTWRIENKRKGFRFKYRVWADDLGVRTSYVDDRFAFLNGASVFVYVVGELDRPAELALSVPPAWTPHTTLPSTEARLRYRAPDYDTLVDNPLLLGEAQVRSFDVDETRFDYVFLAASGTNADVDRLAADAEKIVTAAGRIMGGFPFERYAFLVVADAAGGGGLEHANSTGIILQPWSFDDDGAYVRAQRVAAHEFFHAWNVKRIHDEVLGPFDYSGEVYSELLWFHEGVTTTMTSRLLLAAGLMTPDEYVAGLAAAWTSYVARPGRNAEPVSQIGKDAWIKGYRPSRVHGNETVSYYTKGNLLGVALDLELHARARKHGKRGSLEGMFRRLWNGRKKGAKDRPIAPRDLIDAASAEAGEDMSGFFGRFVDGTEELELPKLLEDAGVTVTSKVPEKPRSWTGIVGNGATIESLDPQSPAEAAGLMIDDEPIAVGGARVRSVAGARDRMSAHPPGTPIEITFFRRGRLERRTLRLAAPHHRVWTFALPDGELSWPKVR